MKNKLTAIIIGTTLSLFTALPALADQCSPNQRMPLPGCVKARLVRGGVSLHNRCSHKVSIKVDKAGAPDQRLLLHRGGKTTVKSGRRFKLNCCPRYSRCN